MVRIVSPSCSVDFRKCRFGGTHGLAVGTVPDQTEKMGLLFVALVRGLLAKERVQECREALARLREAATALLESLDWADVDDAKTAPLILAIELATKE